MHFLHEFHIPVSSFNNSIVTVHDLGPVLYPEYYTEEYRKTWVDSLDRGIRQCKKVLAVSNSLKRQLDQYRPEYKEKYCATPLGVDPIFFKRLDGGLSKVELTSRGISSPYILYTGAADPKKNLVNALKAFQGFLSGYKRAPDVNLLIIGDKNWGGYDQVEMQIKELGIERQVIFTGYIAYKQLPIFYRNCLFFMFLSAFEGFGLPLLEAMAAGVPCLTSDRPAMNEVGADAVAYCDPDSPGSIAKKMAELIEDSDYRVDLAAAGEKRAEGFSWEKTARATLEAYENAVSSRLY